MGCPFPGTDEAVAELSDQERVFYEYNMSQWAEMPGLSAMERIEKAEERFPDEETLEKFLDWVHDWYLRLGRKRQPPPLTTREWLQKVDDTNFNAGSERASWLSDIDRNQSSFSIGNGSFDRFTTRYEIRPDHAYLVPDHEERVDAGLGKTVDHSVLGIELAVPSAGTAPDCPNSGFIFAQLGILYAFDLAYEDPARWELVMCKDEMGDYITPRPWKSTGFGVVARLNSSGRTDGIYVIYNFWSWVNGKPGGDDNRPRRIETKDADGRLLPHIGRLSDDPWCRDRTFTVAKIADSIADLSNGYDGYGRNFHFTPITRSEPRLYSIAEFPSDGGTILVPRFPPSESGIAGDERGRAE